MVQLEVVRQKVARMRDTGQWLKACLPATAADMVGDRNVRDLVSFRVYLLVQDAVDICSHVIADQGWGPVPSLRDHFTFLADKGVLAKDLASQLAAAVKVRNLVGHGYAAVDPQKMHEAASEILALADPFCDAILSFSESHPREGGP
jgi:uncharacterized protein YutE (UPF0331/DUF86 family)